MFGTVIKSKLSFLPWFPDGSNFDAAWFLKRVGVPTAAKTARPKTKVVEICWENRRFGGL